MRAALDALAPAAARAEAGRRDRAGRARPSTVTVGTTEEASDAAARRPGCSGRSGDRRFVISVEIDPPRSVRIERTIEAARLLQAAGVDVVNISDSAMARVRMGAMAVAFGIQHDLDLECLVHFTTRDRNLMALESELLGAHALGVRNILALTGDPPRVGDYPTGTGVWDVDSIGLVEILARLNRGEDEAGSPIGAAGRVHDRLRARPDGGRRRDRVGPARTQARGRRPPDHDPAALRPRAGRGDGHARRGAASGRAASRCRCCWASCRCRARATPSSSTTRCPASRSPTRRGPRCATPASAAPRSAWSMSLALLDAGRRPGRGDLHHAELRALRAGGRAGAPAPRRATRIGVPRDAADRAPTVAVGPRGVAGHRVGDARGRRRSARAVAEPAASRAAVPGARSTARPSTTTPGVLQPDDRAQAEQIIDAIEAQTRAEVVVYTQALGRDDSRPTEAEAHAAALMDEWGVGRAGLDDGLVILFDLDTDASSTAQVQLYAGAGLRDVATCRSDERQAIFDDDDAAAAPRRRLRQRRARGARPDRRRRPSIRARREPAATRPAPDRRPGPPFPDPEIDRAVYDFAGILSPETRSSSAEATIDAIEARTGAEVVVYTQRLVDYGIDDRGDRDRAPGRSSTSGASGEPGSTTGWRSSSTSTRRSSTARSSSTRRPASRRRT